MAKIEHPDFGIVSERRFPGVAADRGNRRSLRLLKRKGLISGFSSNDEGLTVWRPWIVGETPEERFRHLPADERKKESQRLHRLLQQRLEEMKLDHGALHPRNILFSHGTEFVLVDASFNSTRLNPRANSPDDPWVWGPCIPKGWNIADWDRVSLLRTAALLAREPAEWTQSMSRERAIEMCRKWANDWIQSAPVGADFITAVEEAVELLPDLLEADFELPEELVLGPESESKEAMANPSEGSAGALRPGTSIPSLGIQPIPAESPTNRVKSAIAKNHVAWKLCAWTIGVAVTVGGIVVSIYTSVFTDPREWLNSLWGPREPERIPFSALVHDAPLNREAVYVFALDVSGSLYKTDISDGERDLFIQRMAADQLDQAYDQADLASRCGIARPGLKKWDLARAQICYYLHSIEDESYAGLWKFGAAPTLVSGSRAEKLEVNRRPTEEGMRKRLVESLMSDRMVARKGTPDFDITNFEALFDHLSREYLSDSGFRSKDLRFVIVSDFLHLDTTEDQAFYTMSKLRIERKLRDFKQARNASFHLMLIGSNQEHRRFILPSIKGSTRLNQLALDSFEREPNIPMPDFLYGFVSAGRELVFRHSADDPGRIHPIQLVWDAEMSGSDDTQVIIGLRSAVHGATSSDLPIQISEERHGEDRPCQLREDDAISPADLESALLKPGERQSFTIGRIRDWLCLQPLLESNQKAQLTLSCASERAGRNVFAINIRFQRYLPEAAAWVLVACLGLILLTLLACSVLTAITLVWQSVRRNA